MAFSEVRIQKSDLLKSFEEGNQKVINLIVDIESDAVNGDATIESVKKELANEGDKDFFQYQDDGLVVDAEDVAAILEKNKIPYVLRMLAGDTEMEEGTASYVGDLLYEIKYDGKNQRNY